MRPVILAERPTMGLSPNDAGAVPGTVRAFSPECRRFQFWRWHCSWASAVWRWPVPGAPAVWRHGEG
eukprot:5781722-Lingulodinium_polyedra.AAC.1